MKCNVKLRRNEFYVDVPYLLLYFVNNFKKTDNFRQSCWVFLKLSPKYNSLYGNCVYVIYDYISSYLSFALSKVLPHSKTIKTLRNCRHFMKTTLAVYLIFIKLRFFESLNIWFGTVPTILIIMAQVIFFNFLLKSTRTLMPLSTSGKNFHRSISHQLCWFGASNKLKILSLVFQ